MSFLSAVYGWIGKKGREDFFLLFIYFFDYILFNNILSILFDRNGFTYFLLKFL